MVSTHPGLPRAQRVGGPISGLRRLSADFPLLLSAAALGAATALHAGASALPAGYPGTPYQGKVQGIPGRVFLSDFDQGPKDAAWHDYETRNIWACKVRDSTGVGLQLMGQGGDGGDTREADSLVKARMGKCYLAQTNSGDWTKYTVRAAQAGTYSLAMLSAASETEIPFVAVSLLNGTDSVGTGRITLPLTTYFHHWVYTRDLAMLSLDTGLQVLRFDIPGNGPMNIDYIDFTFAGASSLGKSGRAGSGFSVRSLVRESDGSSRLRFSAPGREPVRVGIHDASGALIHSESVRPGGDGQASIRFRGGPAEGMVFVRLVQGGASKVVRALPAGP